MSDLATLDEDLIGRPGSRRMLDTPALVLDRDALERNIAALAAFAAQSGVGLRPHAKTHKSLEIAQRQIAAGAIGICCAKLGEAEALAQGSVDSILLTSPVVAPRAIERLARLNQRVRELIVVVDNPDNAAALAAAVGGGRLSVLIDVDPGVRRTGVASPEAALALLAEIERRPALHYRGLQFYCGVQQHVASFEERRRAIAERTEYLQRVIAQLGKPEIVSGSGTGSHRIDAEFGVMTEWQAGSYVFMDRQYAACDLGCTFEPSLFVDARVISANAKGMATLDAGFKALAVDAGAPRIVDGGPPGSTFIFMGDEHGAIVDPERNQCWQIGDHVRLAVAHCDPTVNLYDNYYVVQGETLVDIWPITARGRSR
jgi:3-hydroxy-D-aspartate aldolase